MPEAADPETGGLDDPAPGLGALAAFGLGLLTPCTQVEIGAEGGGITSVDMAGKRWVLTAAS